MLEIKVVMLMEETLSARIYNQLRDDIDRGHIGDKEFLTESQLARKFGTSKGPVKDALHILCSQGYLISFPRKGYLVNRFSIEEINQMQDVRRYIEKQCAILAIQNASDEQIRSLYQYTQAGIETSDPEKMSNTLFHIHLAEITGNVYWVEALKPLLYRASRIKVGTEFNLAKHIKIVDALLKRDTELAVKCIEDDIEML